jgi:hypothetical protein
MIQSEVLPCERIARCTVRMFQRSSYHREILVQTAVTFTSRTAYQANLSEDFEFPVLLINKTMGPTQPPIQWVPGDLSLGVKRPGREADHSPPSSAEVKG